MEKNCRQSIKDVILAFTVSTRGEIPSTVLHVEVVLGKTMCHSAQDMFKGRSKMFLPTRVTTQITIIGTADHQDTYSSTTNKRVEPEKCQIKGT